MFYLKVEDKSRIKPGQPFPGDPNRKIIEGEKVRVMAILDKLYSYYYCSHPLVLIGEAQVSLSDGEIRRTYDEQISSNNLCTLGNKIQTLCAVNLESGDVKLFKSIACNRPVYLHRRDGALICGSHLKNFKDDGINLELDESYLPEFLVYRYVMPPNTLYKNIKSLPGGWRLDSNPISGEISFQNLWKLDRHKKKVPLEKAVDNISVLLKESLSPLGKSSETATLLLSGGLDSSILGAYCRNSDLKVDSISSGFHAITGDSGESHYAQSAADMLGFNHKIHDVSAQDYLFGLVDSIAIAEEPVHHLQSVILGSVFSGAINPNVKYLINGQGADLLFCNAMHLRHWKSRALVGITDRRAAKFLLNPVLNAIAKKNEKARYLLYDHGDDHSSENHFLWGLEAYGDMDWVMKYCGVDKSRIIEGRRKFLDNFGEWSVLDKITALLFCGDIDETMKIWGKLAEHDKRIVIFPFSYPELMSYVLNLDWELKAGEPKYLLRRVARKLNILNEIIDRPKKSFGFPVKFWALPGSLFQPLVDMASEYFDRSDLESLQGIEPAKAMTLWNMINLYLLNILAIKQVSPADIKREIASRLKSSEKLRS